MKILALVESTDHVCYRYRIEAFAWAMAERGMFLQAEPIAKGVWRRTRQLAAAGRADAVILQRKLLPIWQLALLRRSARRLIYDLDDAVFQRDSYSPKGPTSSMRTARFWATVYAADAVVAGNHFLGRQAAAYAEPQRVHVVPTCVEPACYALAPHRRVGPAARLVWIGQRSTLSSLIQAGEHLAAVAARLPGVELRLIADAAARLPGVRVVPRPWSSAAEAAELVKGDVGIAWLPDDSWSQGKCGLKVLQYMAAGLPVVANPVGVHREMVLDGETGFLAETPAQWAAAIARLAADPALRRRLGAAGRKRVEEHYSVGRWAPAFAAAIEAAIGRAGPRRGIDAGDLHPAQRKDFQETVA